MIWNIVSDSSCDLRTSAFHSDRVLFHSVPLRIQVGEQEFYNPWWKTLEDDGIGTLCYRGKWNLFDQIVLTRPLLEGQGGLLYDGNEVFRPDYLFQHDDKYEGYPLRTHGGSKWLNGYSDHLPTIVYLRKH